MREREREKERERDDVYSATKDNLWVSFDILSVVSSHFTVHYSTTCMM